MHSASPNERSLPVTGGGRGEEEGSKLDSQLSIESKLEGAKIGSLVSFFHCHVQMSAQSESQIRFSRAMLQTKSHFAKARAFVAVLLQLYSEQQTLKFEFRQCVFSDSGQMTL